MAGTRHGGTRVATAAAGVLLLVATAACGSSTAAEPTDGAERPPAGVAELDVPDAAWDTCPEHEALDCADLEVPLDYAVPDGETVTLAVARRPADGPGEPSGSVVVNRGGPGYSATDYLGDIEDGFVDAPVTEAVTATHDLVAVDPRGTGNSEPAVTCFATEEEAAALAATTVATPHTPEQYAARAEADARYVAGCEELSGDLLEHLTSLNSARDLDVVRAALGEDRLDYLGQSYGSYLGTVYAATFPDTTGRLVLDSVLDPTVRDTAPEGTDAGPGTPSTRVGSDVATEETLREFLRLCTEQPACGFAADEGEDPAEAFDEVMAVLADGPVELRDADGATAELTWSHVVTWTGQWLYQPVAWEIGAEFLNAAHAVLDDPAGPEAAELIETIRMTEQMGTFGGPYTDINPGYHAFTCAETDHPADREELAALVADRLQDEAPHFGALRAFTSSPCVDWPATGERHDGTWAAETEEPVLILTNRHDPATPVWSAERLHEALPNSTLLVNEGAGHIAAQQSECVREAASVYLAHGTVPEDGASCAPDWVPFSGEPPPMPDLPAAPADD